MKKLYSFFREKWWIIPLFSIIIFGLSLIFVNLWLLLVGTLLAIVSNIYQEKNIKKTIPYFFDKWWIMPLISSMLIWLAFVIDYAWLLITGVIFAILSVIFHFYIIKKISFYFIDKWWIIPLFSLMLVGLSLIASSGIFIILGLVLITISVIYQFNVKGWKMGCLSGITMIVIVPISFICLFSILLFPSKRNVHSKYSLRYEDQSEIQRILGIEIPEFKIVDSELKDMKGFDFEFDTHCKIEFYPPPNNKFYNYLDSICSLPIPKEADPYSSYFYQGLETINPCWSKEGNKYIYKRDGDFGEKFLHSSDAYFNFEIVRGSRTAEIVYGNY